MRRPFWRPTPSPRPYRAPPPPLAPEADLIAMREAAGQRYARAVGELEAAFVDLAALDGLAVTDEGVPRATFRANQPDGLADLRHREFLPQAPSRLQAKVRRRRDDVAAGARAPLGAQ